MRTESKKMGEAVAILAVIVAVLYGPGDAAAQVQAQVDDGAVAGYINFTDPILWIEESTTEYETPWIEHPIPEYDSQILDGHFGVMSLEGDFGMLGRLMPEEHWVLHNSPTFTAHPAEELYSFGVWLAPGQTDLELIAYAEVGLFWKTVERVFSLPCNTGSRFCGFSSNMKLHSVKLNRGTVLLQGIGAGREPLSDLVGACPFGKNMYGGYGFVTQAGATWKRATINTFGCIETRLDRPGQKARGLYILDFVP